MKCKCSYYQLTTNNYQPTTINQQRSTNTFHAKITEGGTRRRLTLKSCACIFFVVFVLKEFQPKQPIQLHVQESIDLNHSEN